MSDTGVSIGDACCHRCWNLDRGNRTNIENLMGRPGHDRLRDSNEPDQPGSVY